MEVILLEKIGKLGDLGDKVNVKAGYGRNFLFPQRKAVPATAANLEKFEARRAELEAAAAESLATATARAEKIADQEITISSQAGDEGKLFGSIGTKDIADAITAATGAAVEKSEVRLPEGVIRNLGQFAISIQLHSEVTVTVQLAVVAIAE